MCPTVASLSRTSALKESCLAAFLVGRWCVSTLDAATRHLSRPPFFVSSIPPGSQVEKKERGHAVGIPTRQICFAAYGRHGCIHQLCRREDSGARGEQWTRCEALVQSLTAQPQPRLDVDPPLFSSLLQDSPVLRERSLRLVTSEVGLTTSSCQNDET
ncbi:hypothetical protein B0I37DRAFT_130692 [Chaetomium sp. MPI-CAGE-AT-0009]|nr:hypothetical protein B0I37DRAFT_130692 [Chaetomium sp. MPI-CAGE-AT-0009]